MIAVPRGPKKGHAGAGHAVHHLFRLGVGDVLGLAGWLFGIPAAPK